MFLRFLFGIWVDGPQPWAIGCLIAVLSSLWRGERYLEFGGRIGFDRALVHPEAETA